MGHAVNQPGWPEAGARGDITPPLTVISSRRVPTEGDIRPSHAVISRRGGLRPARVSPLAKRSAGARSEAGGFVQEMPLVQ